MSSAAHGLRAALEADVTSVERIELLFSKEADARTFVDFVFKPALEYAAPITVIPRVMLVVGAGKAERSKFSEDLPKWIIAALRDAGYQEDRAASALLACAGTYKYQHDTGKNEKYVQVFPLVKQVQREAAKEAEEEEDSGGAPQKRRDVPTMCVEAPLNTFAEMSQRRIIPWACKRRCMDLLKAKLDVLQRAQDKLTKRVALTAEEQDVFDCAVDLEEKIALLRKEMLTLVDAGELTKPEREEALAQVRARMSEVDKPTEQMKARALALESQTGLGHLHPFANSAARMNQLWQRCESVSALVKKAGPSGRWNQALTRNECETLAQREEWEAELAELAQKERFWFETDEELAKRVSRARALVPKGGGKATASAAPAATKKPQAAVSSSSSWATVGTAKSSSSSKPSASSSRAPGSVRNAFAALDSDSD